MRYLIVLALMAGSFSALRLLCAQHQSGGFGGQSTLPGSPTAPFGKIGSRPRPPDTPVLQEPEKKLRPRFNAEVARKNAQQMAELAQRIPAQVDLLSKNVLPQDLARQLKQIEKLAKTLRSQINP